MDLACDNLSLPRYRYYQEQTKTTAHHRDTQRSKGEENTHATQTLCAGDSLRNSLNHLWHISQSLHPRPV